ncbi:unnamed protein product [Arabidopsis thaliana]|uniref:Replication protein A 70 kDa DNA-binding subunit B/D first OB fold domain-containing protein n=1 Tax=Arabidopsis thaliana TaxID=3702 RepID=A0A5S9XH58_ARATH|nr:unnamed protein product [Arabidopsis thaliana]
MASTLLNSFVYLREINPALEQYKIKIRVVRLWRLFKSIEMALVDGEGTRIHASIEEGLVKRFQHQLVNGESRIIDTFSFVDYDDVLGQIVDVWEVNSVKAKGKDTVKLSFELQDLGLPPGREDLIHVDCEVKTNRLRICFVEAMPKWYYIAYKVCGKKVQPYSQGSHGDASPIYSCGVCDCDVTNVNYRYKLILRASYGASPEVKLLIFDGLAQRLIGKTTAVLFAEVPESDPSILFDVLADLMGKNHEMIVVSNSVCDIIKSNIEMIESSTVDVSLSTDKRVFDDLKPKPDTGKKVFTRKKPKLEKLT